MEENVYLMTRQEWMSLNGTKKEELEDKRIFGKLEKASF